VPHASPLVVLLAAGLGLAFVLGTLAHRLRISPIVGYLLAGVAMGPFTPGYVADPRLTLQLAEIGVILLMFGVGLHFSLKDLLSVRATVLPGAFLQMAVSAGLGMAATWAIGWPPSIGIVFGAALAIASTVVTTRSLQERRLVDSERGRIAVAWLVVQDIVTVLVLVLLVPLAPVLESWTTHHSTAFAPWMLSRDLLVTLAKAGAFFVLMWLVGRRLIPAILHYVAHTGSRELFRLAVLSVALGVALAAAELFGVSIALGAFFAGMMLSESQLSRRAAEESLPLRDAFAVLFFVSVGMLFNPYIFISAPLHLLATLAVVTLGTAAATFLILRALGTKVAAALFVAASLAQIGEFSFVLINLGIGLKLLPQESRDLVLGASILSILLNPVLLNVADSVRRQLEPAPSGAPQITAELPPTRLSNHVVVVGFGRVGRIVLERLNRQGLPVLAIDEAPDAIEALRSQGVEVLAGNGADSRVLSAANLAAARLLFVAIPQAFEAGQIVQQARRANPQIDIVARAHFDAEVDHLLGLGANTVIMGEREIAEAMLRYVASREASDAPPAAPA
jgi:CPA2 family monovalent cation:H+ antiporter-2